MCASGSVSSWQRKHSMAPFVQVHNNGRRVGGTSPNTAEARDSVWRGRKTSALTIAGALQARFRSSQNATPAKTPYAARAGSARARGSVVVRGPKMLPALTSSSTATKMTIP